MKFNLVCCIIFLLKLTTSGVFSFRISKLNKNVNDESNQAIKAPHNQWSNLSNRVHHDLRNCYLCPSPDVVSPCIVSISIIGGFRV